MDWSKMRLRFKRGTEAQLPLLDTGEPGFTTDTKKVFIGAGTENIEILKREDLDVVNRQLVHVGDLALTPLSVGAVGDGVVDDTALLRGILNTAIANNQSVESNKLYRVTEPIVLDFLGKENINIKLRIKPSTNGLGNILHFKNAKNSHIDVGVFNGGVESDNGVVNEGLNACKVRVRGYGFNGTLYRVIGGDSTGNKCVAMDVDIKAENCGRAIWHGDGTASSAFGNYSSIFDRNSRNGSIFYRVNDITIAHYENFFVQVDKVSLTFENSGSIHASAIALGGRARHLIEIRNSVVSVDKLFMIGEDTGEPVSKGLKITHTSDIFPNLTIINNLRARNLFLAIEETGKTNVVVNTLSAEGNMSYVIAKDGIPQKYPIKSIFSYSPSRLEYIDQPSLKHLGENLLNKSDEFTNLISVTGGTLIKQSNQSVYEWGTTRATRLYMAPVTGEIFRCYRAFYGLPGEHYTHSVYIKNNLANTQEIAVNGLLIGGKELNTFDIPPYSIQRFEVSGVMRSLGYYQLLFRVKDDTRPMDITVWHEKIEYGNIATRWTASPKDQEDRILALENAIIALGGTIV